MRTPHNDQLSEPDRAGRRGQHVPERRCVLTGEVSPAEQLVRLALGPDGTIAPDVLASVGEVVPGGQVLKAVGALIDAIACCLGG